MEIFVGAFGVQLYGLLCVVSIIGPIMKYLKITFNLRDFEKARGKNEWGYIISPTCFLLLCHFINLPFI